MVNDIVAVSEMEKEIQLATKPKQTRQIEAVAAASMAWAKEQQDYELFVRSWYAYVMARRKTTELVRPQIRQGQNGREGNTDVTFLADFGFTKMQWNRRCKELEIPLEQVDEYFDEIVANYDWHPSLSGLVRTYVHIAGDSYDWYTPAKYVEAARRVMGSIDLDPASDKYAQKTVKADKFYTKEDDGLLQAWTGRLWLNPPYSMPEIELFVEKAIKHYQDGDVGQAVILTNNSTETAWFQALVKFPFCLVAGRLRFSDSWGNTLAARQGQVFFYLGNYNLPRFIKEFSKFGTVARSYDNQ